MNIEIANRLLELRKKNGLSQDELASKLGISRQSVSKWERAEASPDTDNLICLAKIYGVSLDELLSSDESVDDIAKDVKEHQNKDEIKIDNNAISLTDDEGQTLRIENGHIRAFNADGSEEYFNARDKLIVGIIDVVVLALTMVGYFVWSFVFNAWEVSWVVWVLMPAVMSIAEAIAKRRPSKFIYPCLVTAVYLFLGMQFGLWHPYWFLFITIPFFYMLTDAIEKLYIKEDKDKKEKED